MRFPGVPCPGTASDQEDKRLFSGPSTWKPMSEYNPKTRAQLAEEYGVCRKTFYNWFKKLDIDLPKRRNLFPAEVERIYALLGRPEKKRRKE